MVLLTLTSTHPRLRCSKCHFFFAKNVVWGKVGGEFFPGRTASLLGCETAVLLVGCGLFIFKTRRRVFLNTCLLNHIWLWNVWFCFIMWWWNLFLMHFSGRLQTLHIGLCHVDVLLFA